MRETADFDVSYNLWPVKEIPSKFTLFRQNSGPVRGASAGGNSMQRAQKKN